MAPYLGLLTADAVELKGGGYTRKDLSNSLFRVSPGHNPDELVFVNHNCIEWMALERWPASEFLAVYDDVLDGRPVQCGRFDSQQRGLDRGELLRVDRGMLRFSLRHTGPSTAHDQEEQKRNDMLSAALKALERIANPVTNMGAKQMRELATETLAKCRHL